jgi:hypothetical protein
MTSPAHAHDCGGRVASWHFAGVTAAQQKQFQEAFCRQLEAVEHWVAKHHVPGPHDVPRLKIFVSPEYHLAMSLVPAWNGQWGVMQFPASRVAAGQVNMVHELIHVYLPNGNRLLAEGLSSFVQDEIGSNPAFPNFGKNIDKLVRCDMPAQDLRKVSLAHLDRIATPDLLTVGGESRQDSLVGYVVASSFVRYLIDTDGIAKFRELYGRTPFEPGRRVHRTSDDWKEIYGHSIDDIEKKWKSKIEALTCP